MTNNRIALVTGGTKGIGKAISLMLCRNGYEVWANYHSDDEAAASLKQEMKPMAVFASC